MDVITTDSVDPASPVPLTSHASNDSTLRRLHSTAPSIRDLNPLLRDLPRAPFASRLPASQAPPLSLLPVVDEADEVALFLALPDPGGDRPEDRGHARYRHAQGGDGRGAELGHRLPAQGNGAVVGRKAQVTEARAMPAEAPAAATMWARQGRGAIGPRESRVAEARATPAEASPAAVVLARRRLRAVRARPSRLAGAGAVATRAAPPAAIQALARGVHGCSGRHGQLRLAATTGETGRTRTGAIHAEAVPVAIRRATILALTGWPVEADRAHAGGIDARAPTRTARRTRGRPRRRCIAHGLIARIAGPPRRAHAERSAAHARLADASLRAILGASVHAEAVGSRETRDALAPPTDAGARAAAVIGAG